jgi:NADH-dependent peroxiredoxin subunit C
MLQIGRSIPEGSFQMFHQNSIRPVTLTQYRGRWLVLVFYPGDFTFVCPTELAELADLYGEFQNAGAEVMGVSTDSVYVHKAWHDASPTIRKIQYPLVSDPTGRLARELSVYIEEEGVARRGSFVFDPDGLLCAYEVHTNAIGRNMHELLRKLQAASYVREHKGEEVCPVSWKPGGKTLKPGLDLVGKI